MNILHLMPYTPYPPIFGGALREYHLLRSLARNNNVALVTFGGPEDDLKLQKHLGEDLYEIRVVPEGIARKYHRLAQFGALWTSHSYAYQQAHTSKMQKQLDELLEIEHFDIILTEFTVMGNYHLKTDALKILDEHNIEYDNFYRMYRKHHFPVRKFFYYREYLKMKKEELSICKDHDMIFLTSKRDKLKLDEDVPEIPKYVLPNGVDTDFFHPKEGDAPEPNTLVYTGMMGYVPNNDAMIYFIDQILPIIQKQIPDVKLYIVGNSPLRMLKDRASDNIIITGFVDDVRPYVWRSSVYIVPLRMGGGTRLKVLEALSMKKPVVSTSIGCEGINVEDNESIRIADEPEKFAQLVIELLKSRKKKDKIIENGYELVHSNYDWEVIGNLMQDVLNSLFPYPKSYKDNNYIGKNEKVTTPDNNNF